MSIRKNERKSEVAEIFVSELNGNIKSDPKFMVTLAEEKYHSRIRTIAAHVRCHERIRLVLLAGPSGSGKTTTANLLRDAINNIGEDAIVVSLDDFYRDSSDPGYPKHEDGSRDLECPEALSLEEIEKTLVNIAEGREFYLPKYDFKSASRVELTRHAPLPDGCVIIEGLHALNPVISKALPPECVLKLFVSVSTNINDDGGERILSGRKIRFCRRMTRDSIYRGADAERTLEMWHKVLEAEDIYLYPYKSQANIAFDTFHTFELGVMRPFVERLLTDSVVEKDEYAGIVLKAIKQFEVVDEKLVPDDSLIREFIPGGKYENLY